MPQPKKPIAAAIGATLAGGLMLSGSAFASTQLAQGYLLGAQDAAVPTDRSAEGRCGSISMDSNNDGKVSRAEFTAAHAGTAADFDKLDANRDGYLDADESKMMQAEGRCGSNKAPQPSEMSGEMSGDKAGEGTCGGAI